MVRERQPIRVVQYGLGPIGCGVVRLAARTPGIELVGAVDIAPEKVGRDLGEVAGLDRPLGIAVAPSLSQALAGRSADLAFHTTSSSLARVAPQLRELITARLHVVSTCEELSYPWRRQPALAAELDTDAAEHAVTVLGTGINPGFIMDTLALVLSGICPVVSHVHISRRVDAAPRREPFQRKIGSGRTVADFERDMAAGGLGHVGLRESLDMLSDALGWELDRVDEDLAPVVASQPLRTQYLEVAPGQVAGLRQTLSGRQGGREVVRLELEMALYVSNPGDTITIQGPPDVTMHVDGVHGDHATAAIVVNSAPRVLAAQPGLRTMLDLPPIVALPRQA